MMDSPKACYNFKRKDFLLILVLKYIQWHDFRKKDHFKQKNLAHEKDFSSWQQKEPNLTQTY
jgi:hypothetical protein